MNKTIVIIGAAASSLPLIEAARKRGCSTLVLDTNPNAAGMRHADNSITVDIRDAEACVSAVRPYAPQGVLTLTDFGLQSLGALVDTYGLYGPGSQAVRLCGDKALMRSAWLDNGCDATCFEVVTTANAAREALSKMPGGTAIFKPVQSSGGSRGCPL